MSLANPQVWESVNACTCPCLPNTDSGLHVMACWQVGKSCNNVAGEITKASIIIDLRLGLNKPDLGFTYSLTQG